MKNSELVERIYELLRERGISRGTLEDHTGQLCLLGAGRAAQGVSIRSVAIQPHPLDKGWWPESGLMQRLRADKNTAGALGLGLGPSHGVPGFNDNNPDTVIFDHLETQAKYWRNRGE